MLLRTVSNLETGIRVRLRRGERTLSDWPRPHTGFDNKIILHFVEGDTIVLFPTDLIEIGYDGVRE